MREECELRSDSPDGLDVKLEEDSSPDAGVRFELSFVVLRYTDLYKW